MMLSTVLLGHSLESDLRALQLSHPRCIDTALIFSPKQTPALSRDCHGLRASTIQDRGPGGHDFEEDARACPDLLKARLKMKRTSPAKREAFRARVQGRL